MWFTARKPDKRINSKHVRVSMCWKTPQYNIQCGHRSDAKATVAGNSSKFVCVFHFFNSSETAGKTPWNTSTQVLYWSTRDAQGIKTTLLCFYIVKEASIIGGHIFVSITTAIKWLVSQELIHLVQPHLEILEEPQCDTSMQTELKMTGYKRILQESDLIKPEEESESQGFGKKCPSEWNFLTNKVENNHTDN